MVGGQGQEEESRGQVQAYDSGGGHVRAHEADAHERTGMEWREWQEWQARASEDTSLHGAGTEELVVSGLEQFCTICSSFYNAVPSLPATCGSSPLKFTLFLQCA